MEVLILLAALAALRLIPDKEHPVTAITPLIGLFSCLPNASIQADSGSLVISNGSDETWTNIKAVLEEADGDNFEFRYGSIDPGKKLTIGTRLFTRKDGLMFNPRLYRPKGISIRTDQGAFGLGDTSWCRDKPL